MNVAELLTPRSDESPSGDNVEYEAVFTEMELAGQYGEETQVGDVVREAEEPDFAELAELSERVLEVSHDIRAAVFLAEAMLHTKGLPGYAEATGLIKSYLEDYWDTCHPQLDEDDGDATMRINAVAGLADSVRGVRALRRAPLTESRTFGRLSLRDIDVADGKNAPSADMETVPDTGTVSAAFQDTDDDTKAALSAAASQALANIKAIDGIFADKTPGDGPQLDAVTAVLRDMTKVFGRFLGDGGDDDADDGAGVGGDGGATAGGARPAGAAALASGGGAINSPNDVTNALERIIAYYARSEPSSPLPVLLSRAKRLVNADFMTIIQDMAHEGLDEVKQIGGIKDEDDDD